MVPHLVFLPSSLLPLTWYSWSLPTTAKGIISCSQVKGQKTMESEMLTLSTLRMTLNGLLSTVLCGKACLSINEDNRVSTPRPLYLLWSVLWNDSLTLIFSLIILSSASSSNSFWGYTSIPLARSSSLIWWEHVQTERETQQTLTHYTSKGYKLRSLIAGVIKQACLMQS